ncbi:hypothetical protein AB205_0038310 [Aquarana catesbeiana]|uniref:Uncharacterized protein n=1 Tax=Aquarana catesbeiana TaxID=8400 RepID=A0A2G9Q2Y7_AQUCT|nr:hypothetical protein AB205_0038310 [Aquarana catesbeiana]
MFPIYSSAIKYLCAKYTIFFYIGEKRLGGHPSSEENTDPPTLEEGEIPPTQEEQEEEEDGNWWKLSPQQVTVMLWIQILSHQKVPRS